MRNLLIVLVLTCAAVIGVSMAGEHDARIAKAAYDHGKAVGHDGAMCEVLIRMVDNHWTVGPDAQPLRQHCVGYLKAHAPGTFETISY